MLADNASLYSIGHRFLRTEAKNITAAVVMSAAGSPSHGEAKC